MIHPRMENMLESSCAEIWQTSSAFFLFMDETIIDEQQSVVEWMNGREIPGV